MKYYRLLDDVRIPQRWHLGDVRLADGSEISLLTGRRLNLSGRAYVDVGTIGRSLDFCLTSFAGPIASAALARAIVHVAGSDVEPIPVTVGERSDFVALNAARRIACVDESRSVYAKWTEDDHRPELAGDYRSIADLHILQEAVPGDAQLFRIERWLVGLIVSESVKDGMERVGCVGAKFLDVT
jgi:hypothetical protein